MRPDELPAGTLTFLFTDIEGSTSLVQRLGTDGFRDVLDLHGRALGGALSAAGGVPVRSEGDSFFYVFRTPSEAVAAALGGQRALRAAAWPDGVDVRVRMGLHTGEASPGTAESGVDYVGFDVHRAARIAAAGHGGQVLVSDTTHALVHDRLPTGASLRDLGEHRFKDLVRAERIWQLGAPDLRADFPRIRSLDRTPNNLPTQLTSFVGRDEEAAAARQMMATSRLVTLTGPGGTGKTRLSLRIAAESADAFPDGVYFVALAPIVDPALVIPTLAHVLGVESLAEKPSLRAVTEHLAEKRVLLVLDNFEQVLEAAGEVAELLRACPRLGVLVSSRAALRVYGEQEFPVPPLGMPDPRALPSAEGLSRYEAVRLFLDRARAARPDFVVTDENASAVAGICAHLDGLPLAIELAAARIRVFPPQAMYDRLQARLPVLGTGARDLPARQQTLRGAIQWSYDLLDPGGRRLFGRLSLFAGGGSLPEIEAVCAGCGPDTLDGLVALVDQSLVRQRDVEGEPRFFMLQTIREYGLERMDTDPEVGTARRLHAEAYLALAERGAPELLGRHSRRWLDTLEQDVDNFRAALAWAIASGETGLALRLGAALWRFWQRRGYLGEARATLQRILALPGAEAHPNALAGALEAAGGVAYWQGAMGETLDFYERCLVLCRQTGERAAIANACYNLSFPRVFAEKRPADARALLDESFALYEALGDRPGIAKARWGIGNLYFMQGDFVAARPWLERSLDDFRAIGESFGLGWALHQVGSTDQRERRWEDARARFAEALGVFVEVGDVSGITLVLQDFSRLAMGRGSPQRALRLAGAADSVRSTSGADLVRILDDVENVPEAERIHPDLARSVYEEGRSMTRAEAIAFALEES